MSDRKYQHGGYRSSDKPREPRAPQEPRPAAPPQSREAPRGRGLGAPTEQAFRCARCGEANPIGSAAAFEARCTGCGNDLHSCANCVSFDPGAQFECRQPIAARVAPKDRANRCERFEPRARQEFAREKARPADPRSAFDALFK